MLRFFHGPGLLGGGDQSGRGVSGSKVTLLEDQRPLENHFDLGAGLDVDVGAASEEADEAGGGSASGEPGKAASERMATAETGERAHRASGGDADLSHLAQVAGLVAFLLDGSFLVYRLLAGAGEVVDLAGDLHYGAIGEDHGSKVHVELGAAFDVAGALHPIDNALDVNAFGNEDAIADDDGEDGGEVDAITGAGALGIYRAAKLEQDLGAGGDGVGFGGGRGLGGGWRLLCSGGRGFGGWSRSRLRGRGCGRWLRLRDGLICRGRILRPRLHAQCRYRQDHQPGTTHHTRIPPRLLEIDGSIASKDSPNPAGMRDLTPLSQRREGKRGYDAFTMSERTEVPVEPTTQFAAAYGLLQDAISARAFPGCAFGVWADGRVVLEEALGRFTYEEDAPAVTPQTVFDAASVTKVAATTTAAMLLYQQGRLELETPLADLLPGFVVGREPGTFARHVRLRHLLAHSSGLPGYVEFFREHTTAAGLLRACLELPVETPPGSMAEYSDPGFILLGKALEVILCEPLHTFVEREILAPLGMTASVFCPRPALRGAIPPTEEDTAFRHRTIQGEVQDENAFVLHGAAGHAGLFTNVHDLLLLAREVLAAGGHRSVTEPAKLFHPATVELFAERQPPAGSSRALGWDTPSENSSAGRHFSRRTIGHLGFSGCSLWIDREAGVAVALLTNRTWPDRANQAIREVRPAFHDAVREAM